MIITGGSKGIGYAITNAFGIAKASAIVLLARNRTALEQAHTILTNVFVNTIIYFAAVDITNRKHMNRVFENLRSQLGEPNVLVLCAAYLHPLTAGLDVP